MLGGGEIVTLHTLTSKVLYEHSERIRKTVCHLHKSREPRIHRAQLHFAGQQNLY